MSTALQLAPAPARRTTTLEPVRLPRDERPHATALEWWHFMIHLHAPQPRSLVISLLKGGGGLISGTCALVIDIDRTQRVSRCDRARGRHAVSTRLRPTAMASRAADGFDLTIGDVTATGALGRYRVRAPGVDLVLAQDTPATLLGERGVMTYPGGVELGYYAYTQLAVRGTAGGAPAHGTGWLEHQWGDARVEDYRWRYVAAQLDSGERIAAFAITHARTGEQRTYATLVDPSGSARDLADVRVRGVGGLTRIDARGVSLTLDPVLADQRVRTWLLPAFWEGACTARGKIDGRPVTGHAFAEVVA